MHSALRLRTQLWVPNAHADQQQSAIQNAPTRIIGELHGRYSAPSSCAVPQGHLLNHLDDPRRGGGYVRASHVFDFKALGRWIPIITMQQYLDTRCEVCKMSMS